MHPLRFIPRFTVRRLMGSVAMVGVVLGISIERHQRFGKIAAHYRSEFEELPSITPYEHFMSFTERDNRRLEWLFAMSAKYERAARYPWLPVGPDPPKPE
jgi:hypothetical protein